MANLYLRFFDKQGDPLNFQYIGPTGSAVLDSSFSYFAINSGTTPAAGYMSFVDADAADPKIYLNVLDRNGSSVITWATSVFDAIVEGAKVRVNLGVYPAQNLSFNVTNVSVSGTTVTLSIAKVIGSTIISNQNNISMTTSYQDLPGGYFYGEMYFDPVSAGLYENQQIFIVQQFVVGMRI